MSNNKQSSVEWFEQQLDNLDIEIPYIIFAEAKEMHKEQIINALHYFGIENAKQYYEQTYGGNNE